MIKTRKDYQTCLESKAWLPVVYPESKRTQGMPLVQYGPHTNQFEDIIVRVKRLGRTNRQFMVRAQTIMDYASTKKERQVMVAFLSTYPLF